MTDPRIDDSQIPDARFQDARFQDGGEAPLRLVAQDAADLQVISALVQDAVLPVTEMTHDRKRRRFALLLNRFRWEDRIEAERAGRPFERVRSVLVVEDVLKVQTTGFNRQEKDQILSVLSLTFSAGHEGSGRLTLTLAGDGAVALEVEALDMRLEDVTRPHRAAATRVPAHD